MENGEINKVFQFNDQEHKRLSEEIKDVKNQLNSLSKTFAFWKGGTIITLAVGAFLAVLLLAHVGLK